MIATQREPAGACARSGNATALGAADGLCLAAAQHASPLSGMVLIFADERLPFDSLAEAGLQPTMRCSPVLILRWPESRCGYWIHARRLVGRPMSREKARRGWRIP